MRQYPTRDNKPEELKFQSWKKESTPKNYFMQGWRKKKQISESECKNCSKFEVIIISPSLNVKKNCLKFCKQSIRVHQKILLNSNPHNFSNFYKSWKVNITKIKYTLVTVKLAGPFPPSKYIFKLLFQSKYDRWHYY